MSDNLPKPETRQEQFLAKAAGMDVETPEPITREEVYLSAVVQAIEEGGGGGGTSNYNSLSNKPQIGGVTLQGNKTLAELGIASDATMTGATTESDGTKGLAPQPTVADKDKFLRGDGTWATPSGGGGTSDYADLTNKPQINGHTLTGNQTASQLGIAETVQADWNAESGAAQILNKPEIPAAQVNADWNADSGVAQILNKPTIPAEQVNSDWDASTGKAQILNKPTLGTAASKDTMAAADMSEIVTPLPGVMSRRMKYSTDEQIVGEWIDGRPVYQKTVTGTGTSKNTTWYDVGRADTLFPGIEKVIDVEFTARNSDATTYYQSPFRDYKLAIATGSTYNYIQIQQTMGSGELSFDYIVTLKYIKAAQS